MIVSFWSIFHSKRGWFDIGEIAPMSMDECEPRLLRAGLPQLHDNRKSAVFLILLMFISIAQPVNANNSISRDDFDVLDALMETLSMREENGEAEIANSLAENALSAVDAAAMDQMKGRGEGKSLMLAGDGGGSKAGEGDASDGKARK